MSSKKVCFKCEIEKDLTEFYRHPRMADGHVNKCKECNKKDVVENRKERIDYYRAYERKRNSLPHRVEARYLYQNTDDGKKVVEKCKKRYLEKNPIKRAAHILLGNAVRDGRVEKKNSCSTCFMKKKRLHGHHDDYAKPLEVRWMCDKCHKNWHKENGEGKNAI